MKNKIDISELAEEDLTQIWKYTYDKWGSKKADEYYNDMISQINFLSEFSELGFNRNDIWKGLRSIPIKQHVVFYEVIKSSIFILRILHEKTDLVSYFSKA